MATIVPHTTRSAGTILTAAIYNADHQVHITNANALNTQLSNLGNMSAQAKNNVDITGGTIAGVTIDNSAIGATTPAAGAFTTVSGTDATFESILVSKANPTITLEDTDTGAQTILDATSTVGSFFIQVDEGAAESGSVFRVDIDSETRLTLTEAGDLTIVGDGTFNTSDERLKSDWSFTPIDFERLREVKVGTYYRKDLNKRGFGVGAQGLLEAIPDAVKMDENGFLKVSYAQAALILGIELSKRLDDLEAKLKAIKG